MKKLLFLLLCPLIAGAQIAPIIEKSEPYETQAEYLFSELDLSGLETNFFAEKGAPFANLRRFNGEINDSNWVDNFGWWRIYTKLKLSEIVPTTHMPDEQAVQNLLGSIQPENGTPIMGLIADYETLKPNAIEDNLLFYNNEKLTAATSESFVNKYRTFAMAPVKILLEGLAQKFILPSSVFFNITNQTVVHAKVDFGDGIGFRTIAWDIAIPIMYENEGWKEIAYEVELTDGSLLLGHSKINVVSVGYSSSDVSFILNANTPYLGKLGAAKIDIIYGCGNTQILKPLIILEGVDHPQLPLIGVPNTDFEDLLFELNSNNNLRIFLEDQGYDLIFVDYQDGADFIERNAYTVEALLDWVNSRKQESGSVEQNVIMGISMGGIVARFALRDMEMKGLTHDTRLYISFDSPHLGANVPIGLQAMIDHGWYALSGLSKVEGASEARRQFKIGYDISNNPASRQMLISQIVIPGDNVPSLYSVFQNKLTLMGMPVNCRNVSVVNGSETGQNIVGFQAGDKILEYFSNGETLAPNMWLKALAIFMSRVYGTDFETDLDVWSVPAPGAGWRKTYDGSFKAKVLFINLWEHKMRVEMGPNAQPFDNGPGGILSVSQNGAASNNVPGLAQFKAYCSFIPSISSLNLKEPERNNLNYDLTTPSILTKTPFGNFKAEPFQSAAADPYNRAHVSLNSNNDFFIVEEINAIKDRSLPSILGSSYNFTALTTDRISANIEVLNGAFLAINGSGNAGLAGSGLTSPITNSLKKVYTTGGDCGVIGITINDGGKLELGSNLQNLKGLLYLRSGNSLVLKPGSTLLINDHSKLVIEPGATLIFEPGASIELNGVNAILEVRGTLDIRPGALFTRQGNGFIRFSGANSTSLNIGLDAEFFLSGNGTTDKVMEITSGELWAIFEQDSRRRFTIENALVVNAGKLNIAASGYLQNVKFVTTGFGIQTYGQNDFQVNECVFQGGQYGIFAYQAGGHGVPITINNCSFLSTGIGVKIYDKGFILNNCSFTGGGKGVVAENLIFDSYLNNVFITSVDDGVELISCGSAEVFMEATIITDVTYLGLSIQNSHMNMKCSNIEAWDEPIRLSTGAVLDMSTVNGGSYGGNTIKLLGHSFPLYTFNITVANALYLQNGYNHLYKAFGADKYMGGIYSTYASFANNPYHVLAERNYWHPIQNANSTSPNSSDFSLLNTTIDFSPVATGTLNGPCDQGSFAMSNMISSATSADPLDNCSECQTQQLHGEAANVYFKKKLRSRQLDSLSLQSYQHFQAFDSLVTYPISGNKPKLRTIQKRAWDHELTLYYALNTQQQKANANQSISKTQSNFARGKAQQNVQNFITATTDSQRLVDLYFQKAQLFLSIDSNAEALISLSMALTHANSSSLHYAIIQRAICMVEIEEQFKKGKVNASVLDSLMFACQNSSATQNSGAARGQHQIIAEETSALEISLFPNPANDLLYISPSYLSGGDLEYKISDCSGKLISSGSLDANLMANAESQVDVSTLQQGVYLVEIKYANSIQVKKLVISR